MLLYRVVRALLFAFSKLFWRLSVDGAERVPATGAFVLAPVHRSNVDTPLVSAVTRRRMHFMGKDSMWRFKPAGRLFTALGAFPVHRGTVDREALRKTVDILSTGQPVVIFPEGTRQTGPLVQPLFEGAAYVAARTGVPIVPVGIGGSEQAMPKGAKMLRPVKVHIVVGRPLYPPAREDGSRAPRRAVHELTEQLHTRLQELFDTAQARAARR
ncbi:MAG TPA: lysophospholipid acyltransferase family protein [Acidimicrobiales bacterium]|nr:lysophospholipid acyltransferase family protein [Acidimicrobiales bacterium]